MLQICSRKHRYSGVECSAGYGLTSRCNDCSRCCLRSTCWYKPGLPGSVMHRRGSPLDCRGSPVGCRGSLVHCRGSPVHCRGGLFQQSALSGRGRCGVHPRLKDGGSGGCTLR